MECLKIEVGKAIMDFYDLINTNVWSQSKRDNLIAIFENEDPGHYEKLYFCGFLLNVLKLSLDSVIQIIIEQSNWNKKDQHMTFLQVRSVVHSIIQRNKIFGSSLVSDSDIFLTVFEKNEINETKTNSANTVKKMIETETIAKRSFTDFEPKSCQIEYVHITCYFKKCDKCNILLSFNMMNIQEAEVIKW
jgi:hypothetical protein